MRTKRGDDLSIRSSLKVQTLEARCLEKYGLIVEVAYSRQGHLTHTPPTLDKTLGELNDWCATQGCDLLTGAQTATVQEQLVAAIRASYPDAVVKKINADNYVDIHLPAVHPRRGTHLFFNTSKGAIRCGFFVRDAGFVAAVLAGAPGVERYSHGLRPAGYPAYRTVTDAAEAALAFLALLIEHRGATPLGAADPEEPEEPEEVPDDAEDEPGNDDVASLLAALEEEEEGGDEAEEEEDTPQTDAPGDPLASLRTLVERERGRSSGGTAPGSNEQTAALESGAAALQHPSYQAALGTFRTIATATGILSPKLTREPEPAERDALWEVTRAFAERLYALDIDSDADPVERHHLAHYAVVALHWCDIYLNDPRHSMENGRFRRDTLALALCLFARIDPSYQWYAPLKKGWIAPHVNFSYLLWTLTSINLCNHDNLFNRFTPEEAREALEQKQRMGLDPMGGYIPAEDEPEDSPLHRIWVAVRDAVLGPQGPHKFALAYIHGGTPGGAELLPQDREMNLAWLSGVVSGTPVGPTSATPDAPKYVPDYPGEWYLPNAHWNADGMILRIKSFPNIFAGGKVRQNQLFRRFTEEEVDRIERKIRTEQSLIYLPFVRDALAERFDMRGMKPPFWFIPFVAFGNDRGGILYFEENGFYTNFKSPESLDSTGHVDLLDHLSVTPGYNGLNDSDEDDAVLSSLRVEGHSADGDARVLNIVEFHDEGYGATLRIALAIWEAAWQGVVERSRGGSLFMKGPPPGLESFDSWDALLAWAEQP